MTAEEHKPNPSALCNEASNINQARVDSGLKVMLEFCGDRMPSDQELVERIIVADPATAEIERLLKHQADVAQRVDALHGLLDSMNQTNAAMGKRLKEMEAQLEEMGQKHGRIAERYLIAKEALRHYARSLDGDVARETLNRLDKNDG